MTKAITHIAFNCADLNAQEEFYTKHFGFRRCRVFKPDTADEFIMLRLGPVCLELFTAPDTAPATDAGKHPPGFKHLAFEVPSLEDVIKDLNADGIATEDIRDCSALLEGMRICFFNDPDGNRIELVQGYQDES